jgi:hypothetical protein
MPKMQLPNKAWLKANGHGAMIKAMEADPEVFAHIPREPDIVSERAILARINHKLVCDGERVGINRTGHARYWHMNINPSAVLGDFSDLESFARECGVSAANEIIKE